jgi:Helix-turn-helix domain
MAAITPIPHTRIDNSIIDEYTPQIGLACLGVLVIIKRYVNQKTGQCNPSYKTIARKAGVDRSTIIRYVKKLKAFNLLDPELQFKEDGSPTSNQYHFPSSFGTPPRNQHEQDTSDKGGALLPPLPLQDCHFPDGSDATSPGAPLPPEQSSSSNKKQRTMSEVDLMPTEKQKTCPHPPEFIVILPDTITICHHCYGLLDENFRLIEEEKTPVEIVEAA